MRIAVTGATGYVGQRLIRAARLAGYEVLALSRRPMVQPSVDWQSFDLTDTTPLSLPNDLAAVFHLAAETQHTQGAEQSEISAARRLIGAASTAGAGFVFVSSQTARIDAPTAYGRIKWQIEQETLKAGGRVVRPGQVYGGPEHGLFGALCEWVRRLPVLPAFVPTPTVQPVHVDDLAEALLACLAQQPASMICVAASESISFTAFLKAIAFGRTNRWSIAIPVPSRLIRAIATLLGPSLRNKFGLDRLESLFVLPRMDTYGDLQRLSLTLRPLCDGVSRSGRGRRELLREGRALLTYILRTTPASILVRRYVCAVEALRLEGALHLPKVILRVPALLALIDGVDGINAAFHSELTWRLNAALMLAEASPQGASRFLGLDQLHGWLPSSIHITRVAVTEAGRRVGQLILWPLLARVGRSRVLK